MAKETKGTRRLDGDRESTTRYSGSYQNSTIDDAASYGGSRTHVDDAVVDEILRSISEQSDTPVPPRARTSAPPQQPPRREDDTILRTRATGGNSYSRAAARASQQQQEQEAARNTGSIPDPSYYAMRDPSQSQSFRPARPTHRDTDRIPTIVEEKPIRRKSVVGKVLTFLVTVLVIVALVLGVRMLYLLGPSMGLDLPDLTQLPGISVLFDMVPEEESELPEDTTQQVEDETPTVQPSSVTLDAEEVTLEEGGSVVLTATLDIDISQWDGQIYWATGAEDVATVQSIGPNTAQVTWAGEGRCVVMAYIDSSASATGSELTATCSVTCGAASAEEPAEETTGGQDETEQPAGEHIDIVLNREDFTLNTGESHSLMDENADQVTWTSSDESVATVSDSGVVTAVGSGSCTITATGLDGTTASAICRVR